ncbi:MAG TPA: thioredoxin domain-containing protein [Acidimicrobiales bacterium]|nr:thioredoxin domain-containing protein [Acidimicrobiales bacterium]
MPLLRDVRTELGSAYLLDHVDNPVAWRTWSDDTLDEARRRDLPIFLSVGYAACHWCHVMAHESFEDEGIAERLNANFVPIKVDREERPDVDALYMAATQLVSGHGGWPMSVFLLPDGRPFMAGTYYPPVDRGGQVGFGRLLDALHDAWLNQRDSIERQAGELQGALVREVHFVDHLAPLHESINLASVRQRLRDDLVAQVDDNGGFGGAPKFPRPSFVEALLEFDDPSARRAVTTTLDAMSRRGLYDHLGGGFARYSVDGEWHVPHFEKMLSDQALLARCYLDAARVMNRPEWREVALDTLRFVDRSMRLEGGYAASLDADAGGVEGSHITWTSDEVAAVLHGHGLDELLDVALQRWRIEQRGTFEGRSIPRLSDDAPFLTPEPLRDVHDALTAARATRIQPGRDEKIILEWNAMLASAFLRSGDGHFERRGTELLHSLAATHVAQGTWWRTTHHQAHATAADLAWLVNAQIDAFEISGEDEWLEAARTASHFLLTHYWDGELPSATSPNEGRGVFSQSDLVTDLSTRPKDIFDGATPSAHAVVTRALARLGLCRGGGDELATAQRLVDIAGSVIVAHPGAVVDLVAAAGYALEGIELVVPGDRDELVHHVRSMSMPRTVVITGTGRSPLLENREEGLAYVCRGGVCAMPVASLAELERDLKGSLAWPS